MSVMQTGLIPMGPSRDWIECRKATRADQILWYSVLSGRARNWRETPIVHYIRNSYTTVVLEVEWRSDHTVRFERVRL